MQMGNENVVYTAAADLVLIHLGLGAFPAIDEEQMVIEGNYLGRGMTVKSRDG
jgi:hypothetical protein